MAFGVRSVSYSATPGDPPTNIALGSTAPDTLRKETKLCIAPIIAFGLIGATLGGWIGGSIDPPKKGIEGEMNLSISKTGAICFGVGGIVGGYIGYRLAKRDVERAKKRTAGSISQKEKLLGTMTTGGYQDSLISSNAKHRKLTDR